MIIKKIHEKKQNATVIFFFKNDTHTKKECLRRYKCDLFKDVINKFEGDKNDRSVLHLPKNIKNKSIILYGLGEEKKFNSNIFRYAVSDVAKYAISLKNDSLAFFVTDHLKKKMNVFDLSFILAETVHLSAYSFTKYKTKKEKKKNKIKSFYLLYDDVKDVKAMKKAVNKACVLTKATNQARDLVNEPSNELTPKEFATRVKKIAKQYGVFCKVLTKKSIEKEKMGGVLAVASGSIHAPYFLILHKKNNCKNAKRVCLVGKGVCFDSGGLSLKPAMSMVTMKYDMAGAAACVFALMAASKLGCNHDVTALIPLVENAPDGKAYRPGDIVKIANGLNVEVLNTDAEGRMILADALSYAKRYNPHVVIDIATLTGAAKVCLGDKAAAILGNNDVLINELISMGTIVNERLWQLPLWDDYQDDIKSEIADIKNIGLKGAGTITAAKFLSNFVPQTAWAHVDIASTAWEDDPKSYLSKGASGFGVRLLAHYLISMN